ncbi:universal stress protein [Sinomonas terrae]|uniref:Universal stress protein n=1 Tax=Sinomonas terrae TaxID=2908838 RepID=A0ABS9U567_9MICC|nr:universal stress protein [Sinomonas terrae]MCH6471415.1 universal stress protein [Sinomonas terrae]
MDESQPRLGKGRPVGGAYGPQRFTGPVVAGVTPGQSLAVIHRAADLARSLGVRLVCVHADPSTVQEREADGRISVLPIDPDAVDDDAARVRAELFHGLRDQLEGTGLEWHFTAVSGEPAKVLGAFAEEAGASLIVVGTRERGIGTRFEELIGGSVATHLAHGQNRPVVIVPLTQHPHAQAHGHRRGGGVG